MKYFVKKDYPNFLDHIMLTYAGIEESIKDFSLIFPQIRNKSVEWDMSFPMFLTAFYKYIWETGSIPRQEIFWAFYLNENNDFFRDNNYDAPIMDGLKARAYRAYPSLVRDIHFATYLKQEFTESVVMYNRKLDINEGIDIMLLY